VPPMVRCIHHLELPLVSMQGIIAKQVWHRCQAGRVQLLLKLDDASDALGPRAITWDGSWGECILCDARFAPTPPRTGHSIRARRWWVE